MNLKGRRILVTGGNGYLGSHLIPALEREGAIVFNISRTDSGRKNNFVVDLTNKAAVAKAVDEIRPELIFHLAASHNRNRSFDSHDEIMAVNYYGTVNLLCALQGHRYQNFIFTSSSEIYGDNKAPFKEDQHPAPASPYSLSKVCAENAIVTFSKLFKKKYCILRLFNFFGNDMPAGFFIPQMQDAFKSGNDFKMTGGEQVRDFLYVDDVVQALVLAARSKRSYHQVFNVCSNKAFKIKKLVKELHHEMHTKSKILFGAIPYRENEVWNMLGSNKKIVKRLGFKINYPFKKAVKQLRES